MRKTTSERKVALLDYPRGGPPESIDTSSEGVSDTEHNRDAGACRVKHHHYPVYTTIPYKEIPCDPNFVDTTEFCAHYGYSTQQTANTIVVASRKPEGRNAACVLLATTRLDVNKVVRSMLRVRKVSFATSALTSALTGMTMGGVTPFRLPQGLPFWIDPRVMAADWVIFGGGSRSLKIKVDPAVLIAIGGKVIQDLANPAK